MPASGSCSKQPPPPALPPGLPTHTACLQSSVHLLNDAKGNKDKKDDLLFRRHFPFSSLFPWAVIYFYVLYKIPLFSDNLLQKTPGESFSPGV